MHLDQYLYALHNSQHELQLASLNHLCESAKHGHAVSSPRDGGVMWCPQCGVDVTAAQEAWTRRAPGADNDHTKGWYRLLHSACIAVGHARMHITQGWGGLDKPDKRSKIEKHRTHARANGISHHREGMQWLACGQITVWWATMNITGMAAAQTGLGRVEGRRKMYNQGVIASVTMIMQSAQEQGTCNGLGLGEA
ncbi:hypothetical protein BKA93DRAFT_747923 [Sparassis latifolia]